MKKISFGFTLIELLIVVAIIAILAAIAVPNFLEAQVRAKVSATKADLRSVATAVESYRVDYEQYPLYPSASYAASGFMNSNNPETVRNWQGYTPFSITTPVAYMTSLPVDKFAFAKGANDATHDLYENKLQLYQYEQHRSAKWAGGNTWDLRMPSSIKYLLVGVGPDGTTLLSTQGDAFHNNAIEYVQMRYGRWHGGPMWYDPTNGTVSPGDIPYHGGAGFQVVLYDVSRFY